jgi:hypothetical protein
MRRPQRVDERQLAQEWRLARVLGAVRFPNLGVRATSILTASRQPSRFRILRAITGSQIASDIGGTGATMAPKNPCCQLGDPSEFSFGFETFIVKFQRWAYTPRALLLVSRRHTIELSNGDIESALHFSAAYPDRVITFSQAGGGATLPHAHLQAHLRRALGGDPPLCSASCLPIGTVGSIEFARVTDYPIPALRLSGGPVHRLALATSRSIAMLERPCNLVICRSDRIFLVGRTQDYGRQSKRFGALEVAGVVVAVRDRSFTIDSNQLEASLTSVGISPREYLTFERRLLARTT